MGKLSGTPFPGEPEGSIQWLLLSASLSTYYSIISLFQYFLLGFFFFFFFVYFLPCFSSVMNVAYCSIQHTTFPIPHPLQITSKTSLLSFSPWDYLSFSSMGCYPVCRLLVPASFLCSLQASDSGSVWLSLHAHPAPSAPYFASRTQLPFAFSIWAMPTHLQLSFFSQPRIWQVS